MDSPDARRRGRRPISRRSRPSARRGPRSRRPTSTSGARGDLYEHKAIAEKDLLQARERSGAAAKSSYEIAQAVREQARRKLEVLELKPREFHQPVLVRAPITGQVLEVNVAPGEYRAAISFHTDTTAPLMSIADLSTVWVASDVPGAVRPARSRRGAGDDQLRRLPGRDLPRPRRADRRRARSADANAEGLRRAAQPGRPPPARDVRQRPPGRDPRGWSRCSRRRRSSRSTGEAPSSSSAAPGQYERRQVTLGRAGGRARAGAQRGRRPATAWSWTAPCCSRTARPLAGGVVVARLVQFALTRRLVVVGGGARPGRGRRVGVPAPQDRGLSGSDRSHRRRGHAVPGLRRRGGGAAGDGARSSGRSTTRPS